MNGYNQPYFIGVPRQRGRVFGARARTVARTLLLFLKKNFLPSAKNVGREVMELAIAEIGGVLSAHTSIRKAAKTDKVLLDKIFGMNFQRNLNNLFPK